MSQIAPRRKIFQLPFTTEKFEGDATVYKWLNHFTTQGNFRFQRASVKFDDNDEMIVERWIRLEPDEKDHDAK